MANPEFDFESLLEIASLQPDRIEPPSAWIGHIPFAAWLMRTIRPKIFVELGTHTGASYLAFCQAAEDARLPVKCYAVDTWQGDEHSGFYDETVFAALNDYNQSRYGKFSTLLRTRFDDAVGYFADASIDLLHIDGLHTYEAVRHDFETWEPKLAPGAIVLFHDTNVRERGFGVWRFWNELKGRFPWNAEFVHCHGLGVLCIGDGDGFPGREWLRPDSPNRPMLQRYFASLGSHIEAGERYRAAIAADAAYRADLENHLRSVLSERDAEIGRLNDALFVRDAEIGRLNDALFARDAEIGRLKAQVCGRDSEIVRLNAASALDSEIARLKNAASARDAEIGRLSDALSDRDRELSLVKAERDAQILWLNDERTRLDGELNALVAKLAELQRRFGKLTRSFRWRLVDELVHLPRTAGRVSRWPFVRAAFHKNGRPRGWLRRLGHSKAMQSTAEAVYSSSSEGTLPTGHSVELALNEGAIAIGQRAEFEPRRGNAAG